MRFDIAHQFTRFCCTVSLYLAFYPPLTLPPSHPTLDGRPTEPLYGPYTCTSHRSCSSPSGPPPAGPLVCSLIVSPTPPLLKHLLSPFSSVFLCFGPQPTSRHNQQQSLILMVSFSHLFFIFFSFSAVFPFSLMGLETGVGFLSSRILPCSARMYLHFWLGWAELVGTNGLTFEANAFL